MELLDVNVSKAAEWLQERRKVPADWGNRIKVIHLKQKQLYDVLLEQHKVKGEGYIQVTEVIAKLMDDPEIPKNKSLLGNYQNQTLYDWTSLQRLYDRDNLGVADCASQLQHISNFDLPPLKKQLKSADKNLRDTVNKLQNLADSQMKAQRSFQTLCDKYNIVGVKIREELKCLTRELPVIFLDTQKMTQDPTLKKLIEEYAKLTKENHGAEIDLPTITSLMTSSIPDVNMESLQDKYAPLPSDSDIEEIEIVPVTEGLDEGWVIETVGEHEDKYDLPLEDKETRKKLLIELDELIEFANYSENKADVVIALKQKLIDSQFLITLHESSGSLERLTLKIISTRDQNFRAQKVKLDGYKDLAGKSKAQAVESIEKMKDSGRYLVNMLTGLATDLFVNVRIKFVGDLIAEINA